MNGAGKSRWVKCDDELVYRVTNLEAITNNYGIPEGAKEQDSGTAYVLTYLRNDVIDGMMCPVAEKDIHPEVRNIIIKRFDEEEQLYKERTEQAYYQTLYVVNDSLLKNLKYSRFDLLDFKDESLTKNLPRVVLPKDMFLGGIYKQLRIHCDFLTNKNFRIYLFRHAEIPFTSADSKVSFKGGLRPCQLMSPEVLNQTQLLGEGYVQNAIYVREIDESPMLEDFHENNNQMLVFIKIFDQGELYFVGSMMIMPHDVISELAPEFKRICGFTSDQPIAIYAEVSPFDIRELEDDDVANGHNGFNGDGSIVVIEKLGYPGAPEKQQFLTYWHNLSRSVILNIKRDEELFPLNTLREAGESKSIDCYVDTELMKIAEEIAEAHPGVDRNQILIWRHGPSFDKPSYVFYEHMNNSTVADLLGTKPDTFDGRDRFQYDLKYTIFSHKMEPHSTYFQQIVYAIGVRLKVTQYDILFCSRLTIGQTLEDAARSLGLTPNDKNTGTLRLVAAYRCGQDRTYISTLARAFKVIDPNWKCIDLMKFINETKCSLRIEEIPNDQANVEEGEHLIPVIHFETTIASIFGVSFFVKIKIGQKFGEIKQKLKELMAVSEEEFSIYKFFLFEGVKSKGSIDDQTIVREDWINTESHLIEQPVIAIQHPATPDFPKISIIL